MAFDRFMIAPMQMGLETDLRPFMIPDKAFARLNNAYLFRGRIRKRFGSYLTGSDPNDPQLSRLRLEITPVGLVITTPINLEIGQQFSIGSDLFAVVSIGIGDMLLTTSAVTAQITAANEVTFSAIATTVFFYPALPVMGITNFESTEISNQPTFAFDTRFAYRFNLGAWERLGTAQWSGDNSQFFWSETWRGDATSENLLFTTNYNLPDRTKYWDGTSWVDFMPILNTDSRLLTARIIINFKNCLLYLNTVEDEEGVQIGTTAAITGNFGPTIVSVGPWSVGQTVTVDFTTFTVISDTPGPQQMGKSETNNRDTSTATFDISNGTLTITGNNFNPNAPVFFLNNIATDEKNFYNRCRFSQNGSPVDGGAFRDDVPGRGGYIDASTQEKIITAEFLKDRLIVFFERSTWEIVATQNTVYPFYWQKINTELGAESTFSIVPFDKVTIGIGNIGIHACNGANVERIDEEIPQTVFEIHNDNNGVERVAGIRDYNVEMVYWSFPSETQSTDFPFNNRVLVFNYVTKSWSFNDDSITAFGYFNNASPGVTWAHSTGTWEETLQTWGSGANQGKFRQVIAGNQQGFMFIVSANKARNAAALSINNMTVAAQIITIDAINHNLSGGDFVVIENAQGMMGVNGIIYEVQEVTDANTFLVVGLTATGTYTGGGTIARVSQIDILTKMYNFYSDKGRNCYVEKVDFLVDRTESGKISVDYYPSYSQESAVEQGRISGALLGNGVLETSPYALIPFESQQNQLWHPMYPQTEGETVQLRIFLDRPQMLDTAVWQSDFQLHAMTFYTTPTSSRLQ